MNRRRVLASVGAALAGGLAGCLDSALAPRAATDESSPDDWEYEEPAHYSRCEEVAPDSAPSGTILDRVDRVETTLPTCRARVDATVEAERDDGVETIDLINVRDYPEPPAELTRKTVSEFVEEHEKAYQQNDFICSRGQGGTISFSVGFDVVEHLDWYDDIFVVRLDISVSDGQVHDDGADSIGHWPYTVVYGVDETGVVRWEHDGHLLSGEEPADPVEAGELVGCL